MGKEDNKIFGYLPRQALCVIMNKITQKSQIRRAVLAGRSLRKITDKQSAPRYIVGTQDSYGVPLIVHVG